MLTETAVRAWHPVCLYRLSLGRQDKLQHVVQDIQQQSGDGSAIVYAQVPFVESTFLTQATAVLKETN